MNAVYGFLGALAGIALFGIGFWVWRVESRLRAVATDHANGMMTLRAAEDVLHRSIEALEKRTGAQYDSVDNRLKDLEPDHAITKQTNRESEEREEIHKFTTARALRAHLGGLQ